MRSIYFNDQTQEFIEKEFDIVFLGNLYLKGKPYTNPKEAVDKEYVDNLWDNITEENLTKTRFNPKNFPGFNADLVNKEGTNNFLLKEIIKAGKYHKVLLDNRGRVTGGRTGKVKLDSSDFGGISYSKLHYRNYKNTNGVFGKPDKIADYTNGLNTKNYLYKAKDNVINRPLRLESGPVTEHNIINEDEMLNITDQYFIGKISGQKEKSFAGYGDWGGSVSNNYDIHLQPWKFQRSFNPNSGNIFTGGYRLIFNYFNKYDNKSLVNYRLVVHDGYLYNLNPANNDNVPGNSWAFKLTDNGKITGRVIQSEKNNFYDNTWIEQYGFNNFFCQIDNFVYMSCCIYKYDFKELIAWKTIKVTLKNGTINYDLRRDKNGLTAHVRMFNNKAIEIMWADLNVNSYKVFNDGNVYWEKSFPGENNAPHFPDGSEGIDLNVAGFLYLFSNKNYGYVNRIRLVNSEYSGEWEKYYITGLPEGHKTFFTSKGSVYMLVKVNQTCDVYLLNINLQNGDLSTPNKIFSFDTKSDGDIRSLCIAKNTLFVCGYDWLVEVDIKGGKNTYTQESNFNYVPPHP